MMLELLEFAASWALVVVATFAWGLCLVLSVSSAARERLWAWLFGTAKQKKNKKVSRPQTLSEYGREEYWQKRYKESSETYEWYCVRWSNDDGNAIVNEFRLRFKKSDTILDMGCGTSAWGDMARQDGFLSICNVDFSAECVAKMRKRFPEGDYRHEDLARLSLGSDTFAGAFDKGTIDGLLGDAKKKDVARTTRVVRELARVVRSGGFWLNVGVSKPEPRVRGEWARWWKQISSTRIPILLEGDHLSGPINLYMNVYMRRSID